MRSLGLFARFLGPRPCRLCFATFFALFSIAIGFLLVKRDQAYFGSPILLVRNHYYWRIATCYVLD
jgi:hypothetical protein